MYTDKPYVECEMPDREKPLRALVLLATLKRTPEESNTEELARLVLDDLKVHGVESSEIVRLVDHNIPAGLGENMGTGDASPNIADRIRAADIVLHATPIQWGVGSSSLRRCLERQDSLEEIYRKTGWSPLYDKVAGVIITGSEDGAQHTNGNTDEAVRHMSKRVARNLAFFARLLKSHPLQPAREAQKMPA